MKTKIFTLLALTVIVLSTQYANAKIRRVGYFGTAIVNTDYTDLQSAHDASAAGDTLLIFPGNYSATYSKKLVTIGYGYYSDTLTLGTGANAALQNIKGALGITVYLSAGADNNIFEGLDGISINSDNSGATISNITIRRCYGYIFLQTNNTFANWQILQCFLAQLYLSYYPTAVITNLTVNNSFINSLQGNSGAGTASNQTGQFTNCIFLNSPTFNNGSFIIKNSIFAAGRSFDVNCVYSNNVINTDYGSIPGNGNVNINGTSMYSSVFVGYDVQGTYSQDNRWSLKPGSPAIGAGVGGTNCGIFGGANPYKLSGIPRIPAFYKLTAPSNITSTNPYTITFSVRSNN